MIWEILLDSNARHMPASTEWPGEMPAAAGSTHHLLGESVGPSHTALFKIFHQCGFQMNLFPPWIGQQVTLSHISMISRDKLFSEIVQSKSMKGVGIYSKQPHNFSQLSQYFTQKYKGIVISSLPFLSLISGLFQCMATFSSLKSTEKKLKVAPYLLQWHSFNHSKSSWSLRIIPQQNHVLKHCFSVKMRKYGWILLSNIRVNFGWVS